MKLEDLIKELQNPALEELIIYQKDKLDIDGEIFLFNINEVHTTEYIKDNIRYVYLLEVFIANEVVEGWMAELNYTPTDKEIAQRIFDYGVYDA